MYECAEIHGIVPKLPTSAQVSNEVLADMKHAFANFEERPRLRVVAVELDYGVGDIDITDGDTCVEPSYIRAIVFHTSITFEPSCSTLVDRLNLTRLSMMLQARLPRCTLQAYCRCPTICVRARP